MFTTRSFLMLVIWSMSSSIAIPAQSIARTTIATVNQQSSTTFSTGLQSRITIDLDGVSFSDALKAVASQASQKIVVTDPAGRIKKRVTLQARNMFAVDAFKAVLEGTPVRMTMSSKGQLLFDVASSRLQRAQGTIAGRVIDSKTGKGIQGANVSVGADNSGAVSGEDGSYRLGNVSSGTHTVTVRIVGYAKQVRSVTVGEGTAITVDFKLDPSASVLDQVIVTGTVVATELKAVPSAITVITAKQIEERGITRIDQLFRGEIPGLFTLETGASAAGTSTASLDEVVMFSRGTTKISTSSNPVNITNPIKTYVDGVELSNPQYLSQIDPRSIERIEILTGPQASTIYGANAINGVMQIFTKRGSTAKPSITLSLSEGLAQNNFGSALSPSHQYDGSISGTEGKLSYNVGSGWDYTGAWSPGKQMQRSSAYGGTRYQSDVVSLDMSARQGWTQNKQKGGTFQASTVLVQEGKFTNLGNAGLVTPRRRSLSGRTLGVTLGYTPVSWWSHQMNLGSDASDIQDLGSAAAFTSQSDTSFSNTQTPNVRVSQSYSSTLRFPIFSLAQAMFTYGADHWRTRTSTVSWAVNPNGSFSSPSVTRSKPDKNSGAYVQGQLELWDALFLTYGARADWNPNYGEKVKVRPSRYGVSYARELGTVSAKLRGSYGRSIRPPVAGLLQGSLVLPDGGFNSSTIAWYAVPGSILYRTLPSPELGPEFQQGGEGGLELYLGNRGSLVVTRYNQTVDGLISSDLIVDSVRAIVPGLPAAVVSGCDPTSTSPSVIPRSDGYCYFRQNKNVNVGSVRNQGWEMQGSVNLGPVTTRGTYSWVKSRVIGITPKYRAQLIAQAPFSPGQTFNFVPEHTWAMNVSYARQGTSVLLNVNGLGQSTRRTDQGVLVPVTSFSLRLRAVEAYSLSSSITQGSIRLSQSGYTTANMNASHRLSERLEATLQLTNLTNHYQNDNFYIYPTVGRQTRFGARVRWQ